MAADKSVDSACDQFEAAWKTGQSPDISQFVKHVSATNAEELVRYLVPVDIEYRMARGDSVLAADYLQYGDAVVQLATRELTEASGLTRPELTVISSQDNSLIESVQGVDDTLPPRRSRSTLSDRNMVGRYHVVQELSSGGQGKVYRALHPNMPLEVAIKVSVNAADPATHQALLDESAILCDLQHPGIARVLDLDFDESQHPFVVLEFIRGLSLQQRLKSDSCSPSVSMKLIEDLANALEYAHSRGVLHLDLKPGNIVFDEHGDAKIIDFGLAKIRNVWTEQSGSSFEISGTPAYMSPEQAVGDQSRIDARSDQFSLAAILVELLTGQRLYAGNVMEQIQQARQHQIPEDLMTEVTAATSPLMAAAIGKALSCKSEDRFASVEDFSNAIRTASANDDPVAAAKLGNRKILLMAATILIAGLISFWQFGKNPFQNQLDSTAVSELQQKPNSQAGSADEVPAQNLAEADVGLFAGISVKHISPRNGVLEAGPLFENGVIAEGDFLQVTVQFSTPTYAILVAINPDGVFQGCYPDGHDASNDPKSLQKLIYPADAESAFPLTDGTGQQAFILVTSSQPLPPLSEVITDQHMLVQKLLSVEGRWLWEDGIPQNYDRRLRGTPQKLPGAVEFRDGMELVDRKLSTVKVYGLSFPIAAQPVKP